MKQLIWILALACLMGYPHGTLYAKKEKEKPGKIQELKNKAKNKANELAEKAKGKAKKKYKKAKAKLKKKAKNLIT